jgi:hypothetical protein
MARERSSYVNPGIRTTARFLLVSMVLICASQVVRAFVEEGPAGALFWVLVGIGAFVFLARVARMGIYAEPEGLVVRTNLGRTKVLPWSEIEDFETHPAGDGLILGAQMRSGQRVLLDCTGPTIRNRRYAEQVLEPLRAELARRGLVPLTQSSPR